VIYLTWISYPLLFVAVVSTGFSIYLHRRLLKLRSVKHDTKKISLLKNLLEIGLIGRSIGETSTQILEFVSRLSLHDNFIYYKLNSRSMPVVLATNVDDDVQAMSILLNPEMQALNTYRKPKLVKIPKSDMSEFSLFSLYPVFVDEKYHGCLVVCISNESHYNLEKTLWDVSELLGVIYSQIEQKESLLTASRIDKLTQLPNRAAYDDTLSNMITDHSLSGSEFTYIIVDIDKFKLVNDNYGHEFGDVVLKEVSSFVNKSVRPEDSVYRIGGEEFVILMPHTKPRLIADRLDILRDSLSKHVISAEISGNTTKLKVTASFGVSSYPKDTIDTTELKDFADKALYFSKETGRNKVTLYESIS